MKFKISYDYMFTKEMEESFNNVKKTNGTNGIAFLISEFKKRSLPDNPQVENYTVELVDDNEQI